MATNKQLLHSAYGLTVPLSTIPPLPVFSSRAPTVNDRMDPGTFWYLTTGVVGTEATYTLVEYIAGVPSWVSLSNTASITPATLTVAGEVIFSSLTSGVLSTDGSGVVSASNALSVTSLSASGAIIAGTTLASGTTITAGSSLAVTTTAVIGTGLTVSAGGAAITGNSSVVGTFGIVGAMTFVGALGLTGAETITGALTQSGGNVSINGIGDVAAATIAIGTGAGVKTVSIGSSNGGSSLALLAGTGNFTLNGAATTTYSLFAAATSGTVNIGGTGANTGTVTLFGGTGGQIINFAANTGPKGITIGGSGANVIKIGDTSTLGTIAIGSAGTTSTTIGNSTGTMAIRGTTIGLTGTTTNTGNFGVTSGDIALNTAGKTLKLKIGGAGADAAGTATLVGGTVTVSTTAVAANSIIMVSRNTTGGTAGNLNCPSASIVAATSFVINSSNALDTSTVNWFIINQS